MLLDKDLDLSFAQNARELREEEVESAKLRGFELESVPVAIDGIVFYVNKSLGIEFLSIEQLRDIYLGKIKNWTEIEASLPDLPITAISLDTKSNEVLNLLMGNRSFKLGDEVQIVRDYTTAIRQVAETPGAISYGSTAILKGQQSIQTIAVLRDENTIPVSAILTDGTVNLEAFERNNYPLTRELYVLIRRDGSSKEKAGVAYANFLISNEGQEIIRKAGFVPIYPSY